MNDLQSRIEIALYYAPFNDTAEAMRLYRELLRECVGEIERLRNQRDEGFQLFAEKAGEKAYWAREFYRLRDHCERVTGTSPVDIGPQDD